MYIAPLGKLIEEFERLPGIGRKTAARLAFYMINQPMERAEQFASALVEAKKAIHYCSVCQDLTDEDVCAICKSPKRTHESICVVEGPKDVLAMEKTKEYNGLYHVLHGCLSPMEGIGPEDIKIRELLLRLSGDEVKEVIMATNPTVEGEATAMYLAKLIHPLGVKVTRIGSGLPVGADIEYADEMTLTKALEGRREI